MKLQKKNKELGITLIALAVTIIVMLILAGVTMAALTSENGIINQASKVKETSKVAKTEEEARLEYSNLIVEKQMEGHGEVTELSDVIGKLEENGYETAEKDGKNYIKIGEYYYEIKLENNQVSIAREKTEGITGGNGGGSTGIAGKKYDTDTKETIGGKEVSIPAGATVSKIPGEYENVENGIVIYIVNDDKAKWENVEYMQKTYDQFVWVPVENAVLDLSSTYSTLDDEGIKAKVQEQINVGKYPMAIKTGTQTEGKDNYIGVLYGFSEVTEDGKTYVKVVPNSIWTPKSTFYREPSALNSSRYDNNTSNLSQVNSILNTNYSDSAGFGKALQSQYNEMVEKVKNAGGFWVGRYETSSMSNSATRAQVSSKKGTTSGISSVTWYRMYAQQSIYSELVLKSEKNKTQKTSSMIWGSQYDQIMIWMKGEASSEQAQSIGKYYITNGVGKGNYGEITIDGNKIEDGNDNPSAPASTGSQETYRVKNIYDLAGNVMEWTLEANGTSGRVLRGGYYNDTSSYHTRPGIRNNGSPTYSGSNGGSRLTLY